MSDDLMELARTAVKRSGLNRHAVAKRAELSYSRVHDLMSGRDVGCMTGTVCKIVEACGFELVIRRRGKKGKAS